MEQDRVKNAVAALRDERLRRYEDGKRQAHLLRRLHGEIDSAISAVDIDDPITRSSLVVAEWDTSAGGASLAVSALAGGYAFGLDVEYDVGARLTSIARVRDEDQDVQRFGESVFRGTPLRLHLQGDVLKIERRRARSGEVDSMDAILLLSTFIEAVTQLERMR